jgi:hypothetical protein
VHNGTAGRRHTGQSGRLTKTLTPSNSKAVREPSRQKHWAGGRPGTVRKRQRRLGVAGAESSHTGKGLGPKPQTAWETRPETELGKLCRVLLISVKWQRPRCLSALAAPGQTLSLTCSLTTVLQPQQSGARGHLVHTGSAFYNTENDGSWQQVGQHAR